MVTENLLEVGKPRMGAVYDGDANTPYITAMLLNDGAQTLLYVSFELNSAEPVAQWIRRFFRDGPNADGLSGAQNEVPKQLWFQDSIGLVALVNCFVVSGHIGKLGEGKIAFQYVVFEDSNFHIYEKLLGLRSELPTLSAWVGIKSVSKQLSTKDDGTIDTLALEVKSPDPIKLSVNSNLLIRPSFGFSMSSRLGKTVIDETLLIETTSDIPLTWESHQELHSVLADLSRIASWSDDGFSKQWGMAQGLAPGNTARSSVPWWGPIHLGSATEKMEDSKSKIFLFGFDDVKDRFDIWRDLRTKFRRGLDPILWVMNHPNLDVLTVNLLLSIGLEAVGYQIALDEGVDSKRAGNLSQESRLKRIADQITVEPGFDIKNWASSSAAVYNGIKHANRSRPEFEAAIEVMRQNQIVSRLWVAKRLEVNDTVLQRNMGADRMFRPYQFM